MGKTYRRDETMPSWKKRNAIAKDLHSGKYRQRVVPDRKRIDNEEDQTHYYIDVYLEDGDVSG